MEPPEKIDSKTPKQHLHEQIKNEKCDCAKLKVECNDSCGCDPEKCFNRQMSLKQALIFGKDVEERVSWGMDICTQVNFLTLMPRDIPFQIQSTFVEKQLIFAI